MYFAKSLLSAALRYIRNYAKIPAVVGCMNYNFYAALDGGDSGYGLFVGPIWEPESGQSDVGCIPHFGFGADGLGLAVGHGEFEVALFDGPFAVVVYKGEVAGRDGEFHFLAFSRL